MPEVGKVGLHLLWPASDTFAASHAAEIVTLRTLMPVQAVFCWMRGCSKCSKHLASHAVLIPESFPTHVNAEGECCCGMLGHQVSWHRREPDD